MLNDNFNACNGTQTMTSEDPRSSSSPAGRKRLRWCDFRRQAPTRDGSDLLEDGELAMVTTEEPRNAVAGHKRPRWFDLDRKSPTRNVMTFEVPRNTSSATDVDKRPLDLDRKSPTRNGSEFLEDGELLPSPTEANVPTNKRRLSKRKVNSDLNERISRLVIEFAAKLDDRDKLKIDSMGLAESPIAVNDTILPESPASPDGKNALPIFSDGRAVNVKGPNLIVTASTKSVRHDRFKHWCYSVVKKITKRKKQKAVAEAEACKRRLNSRIYQKLLTREYSDEVKFQNKIIKQEASGTSENSDVLALSVSSFPPLTAPPPPSPIQLSSVCVSTRPLDQKAFTSPSIKDELIPADELEPWPCASAKVEGSPCGTMWQPSISCGSQELVDKNVPSWKGNDQCSLLDDHVAGVSEDSGTRSFHSAEGVAVLFEPPICNANDQFMFEDSGSRAHLPADRADFDSALSSGTAAEDFASILAQLEDSGPSSRIYDETVTLANDSEFCSSVEVGVPTQVVVAADDPTPNPYVPAEVVTAETDTEPCSSVEADVPAQVVIAADDLTPRPYVPAEVVILDSDSEPCSSVEADVPAQVVIAADDLTPRPYVPAKVVILDSDSEPCSSDEADIPAQVLIAADDLTPNPYVPAEVVILDSDSEPCPSVEADVPAQVVIAADDLAPNPYVPAEVLILDSDSEPCSSVEADVPAQVVVAGDGPTPNPRDPARLIAVSNDCKLSSQIPADDSATNPCLSAEGVAVESEPSSDVVDHHEFIAMLSEELTAMENSGWRSYLPSKDVAVPFDSQVGSGTTADDLVNILAQLEDSRPSTRDSTEGVAVMYNFESCSGVAADVPTEAVAFAVGSTPFTNSLFEASVENLPVTDASDSSSFVSAEGLAILPSSESGSFVSTEGAAMVHHLEPKPCGPDEDLKPSPFDCDEIVKVLVGPAACSSVSADVSTEFVAGAANSEPTLCVSDEVLAEATNCKPSLCTKVLADDSEPSCEVAASVPAEVVAGAANSEPRLCVPDDVVEAQCAPADPSLTTFLQPSAPIESVPSDYAASAAVSDQSNLPNSFSEKSRSEMSSAASSDGFVAKASRLQYSMTHIYKRDLRPSTLIRENIPPPCSNVAYNNQNRKRKAKTTDRGLKRKIRKKTLLFVDDDSATSRNSCKKNCAMAPVVTLVKIPSLVLATLRSQGCVNYCQLVFDVNANEIKNMAEARLDPGQLMDYQTTLVTTESPRFFKDFSTAVKRPSQPTSDSDDETKAVKKKQRKDPDEPSVTLTTGARLIPACMTPQPTAESTVAVEGTEHKEIDWDCIPLSLRFVQSAGAVLIPRRHKDELPRSAIEVITLSPVKDTTKAPISVKTLSPNKSPMSKTACEDVSPKRTLSACVLPDRNTLPSAEVPTLPEVTQRPDSKLSAAQTNGSVRKSLGAERTTSAAAADSALLKPISSKRPAIWCKVPIRLLTWVPDVTPNATPALSTKTPASVEATPQKAKSTEAKAINLPSPDAKRTSPPAISSPASGKKPSINATSTDNLPDTKPSSTPAPAISSPVSGKAASPKTKSTEVKAVKLADAKQASTPAPAISSPASGKAASPKTKSAEVKAVNLADAKQASTPAPAISSPASGKTASNAKCTVNLPHTKQTLSPAPAIGKATSPKVTFTDATNRKNPFVLLTRLPDGPYTELIKAACGSALPELPASLSTKAEICTNSPTPNSLSAKAEVSTKGIPYEGKAADWKNRPGVKHTATSYVAKADVRASALSGLKTEPIFPKSVGANVASAEVTGNMAKMMAWKIPRVSKSSVVPTVEDTSQSVAAKLNAATKLPATQVTAKTNATNVLPAAEKQVPLVTATVATLLPAVAKAAPQVTAKTNGETVLPAAENLVPFVTATVETLLSAVAKAEPQVTAQTNATSVLPAAENSVPLVTATVGTLLPAVEKTAPQVTAKTNATTVLPAAEELVPLVTATVATLLPVVEKAAPQLTAKANATTVLPAAEKLVPLVTATVEKSAPQVTAKVDASTVLPAAEELVPLVTATVVTLLPVVEKAAPQLTAKANATTVLPAAEKLVPLVTATVEQSAPQVTAKVDASTVLPAAEELVPLATATVASLLPVDEKATPQVTAKTNAETALPAAENSVPLVTPTVGTLLPTVEKAAPQVTAKTNSTTVLPAAENPVPLFTATVATLLPAVEKAPPLVSAGPGFTTVLPAAGAPLVTSDGTKKTPAITAGSLLTAVQPAPLFPATVVTATPLITAKTIAPPKTSPAQAEKVPNKNACVPVTLADPAAASSKPSEGQWGAPRPGYDFVSTDPAENSDNFNAGWARMRNASNDAERYRCIRERWCNLGIPDPSKNLTYRHRRAAQPCHTPVCPPPPARRHQRSQSCTTMYELMIAKAKSDSQDRISKLETKQRAAVAQLLTHHSREKARSRPNLYYNQWTQQPVCNQLQQIDWDHMKELNEIGARHSMQIRRTRVECEQEIQKYREYMEEAHSFYSFYQGLDQDDPSDKTVLTADQVELLEETERMYDEYHRIYRG